MMMDTEDDDEEEELNEFHLPDDESEWTTKLESHREVTSIRLFVDEMPEIKLRKCCKELGQKLENLASLLICPYNESCPIIRVTGELLQLRCSTLEELRLWFSEPVQGSQADYEFLFQQLSVATSLKEFELHNPYEWEITDGTLEETQVVPWILQSVLKPLNNLPNLHDVAFSTFPMTPTKETEAALLQLCQRKDGNPDLTLNIYDSNLSSTFLAQVCGAHSRVSKLILTAIHDVNESGLAFSPTGDTLKSLVVRRMPGSKFTSADLTAQTASTIVTAVKNHAQRLEHLELSVKIVPVDGSSSSPTQPLFQSLSQLEHLKTLTIQWNGKTYQQVWNATTTLVNGIGSNKSLTKLVIKARINQEEGAEAPAPEAPPKTAAEELRQAMQTAVNQHGSLETMELEGVLTTIRVVSCPRE